MKHIHLAQCRACFNHHMPPSRHRQGLSGGQPVIIRIRFNRYPYLTGHNAYLPGALQSHGNELMRPQRQGVGYRHIWHGNSYDGQGDILDMIVIDKTNTVPVQLSE